MATYVIGDIHGNPVAVDDLLTKLELELRGDHTIVFLGDYIDWVRNQKAALIEYCSSDRRGWSMYIA